MNLLTKTKRGNNTKLKRNKTTEKKRIQENIK